MHDTLIERIHGFIRRHGLLQAGERVVVGVSGGTDSVALLALLVRLRDAVGCPELQVAHVHHGWRGADAEADATFVIELAARWHVPASVERVDALGYASAASLSPEDAARRVRYDALARVAHRCHARVIAVGHTRDDQAETVLMRLVRGSGLAGTAGIPVTRSLEECRVVRPLLGVWREELRRFLDEEGLTARQDATNDDTTFLRNRVRRELLPLLARAYNPQIKDTLARWAEEAGDDYAYVLQQAASEWHAFQADATPDAVRLPLAWLSRAPLAMQRQVLRLAIRHVKGDLLQIDFRHWEALQTLMTERPVKSRVDLPDGVSVTKQPRALVIARRVMTTTTAREHAGKDIVLHET